MAIELGRVQVADKLSGDAIGLNPRFGPAWTVRGEVAELKGRPDEALLELNRALDFQHDDRRTLFLLAELYRQQDRADRALSTLETLRDCYAPGEEPQRLLLLQGLAYGAMHRYDDAADVYRLALNRDPQSMDLFDRLAESQLLGGRADAAITIDQAFTLDPNHPATRALARRVELALRPTETRRE